MTGSGLSDVAPVLMQRCLTVTSPELASGEVTFLRRRCICFPFTILITAVDQRYPKTAQLQFVEGKSPVWGKNLYLQGVE